MSSLMWFLLNAMAVVGATAVVVFVIAIIIAIVVSIGRVIK